jgi:Enolase C-terminal domain-like
VKSLANQTAKVTEEIAAQIAAIQSATGAAVGAISGIGDTIRAMNEITTMIASAVEEQGAATREIARNIQEARRATSSSMSGWSGIAKTTIRRAKLFKPFNLLWIEEPLHPDNLSGYARVAQSVDTYLAAGEEECTLAGFLRLTDQGKIDIGQLDMTRCGLTQAMKIAKARRRSGPTLHQS